MTDNISLLVEKYRPKHLYNSKGKQWVIGNEDIIKSCAEFIKQGKMPHLIFSGPPGVGKTTIAIILSKAIAGSINTLTINASDENGINVMRGPVKNFAETVGQYSDRLKIVILDESDNMTAPAQQSLRRTMEENSKYCRFIFICNRPSKIIDPIKSRCIEFNFKKIDSDSIFKRLRVICKKEKINENSLNIIKINDNQLKKIIDTYSGDMRKCLSVIGAVKNGADIRVFIHKMSPEKFLKLLITNNLKGLRLFLDENVTCSQDLKYLTTKCIDLVVSDEFKVDSCDVNTLLLSLTEADYRLAMGSSYYSVAFWISLNTAFYNVN